MDRHEHHGKGIRHELRLILRRGRHVWKLVPARHKLALGGATLLMAVTSGASTAIALLLGRLVDRLERIQTAQAAHQSGWSQAWTWGEEHLNPEDIAPVGARLIHLALFFLILVGLVYLVRELVNVARRYLVENTCTRIDRDMTVRVVAHLLKVNLGMLTTEKVGALHGRISRSVEGFVRFLRLFFLDFLPAILTGLFALAATLSKQPILGLMMMGVVPISIFLTVWQLISQKGVRLKLLRTREEMDGTVVEQLGGLDYVRAANTQQHEIKRVARTAEKRRSRELRHHFQMSLFGMAKALNEGFFHIFVLGLAIYLALHGRIQYGYILTFSMLFMNVMTPLAEVHRIIDEGHECSLKVGDLVEVLHTPIDPSFDTRPAPARHATGATPVPPGPEPSLDADPLIAVQNLQVEYQTADGQTKQALAGLDLSIRRGEWIGIAGRSGCGKSTWLKVLMRLTHPTAGSVFFGGLPLDEVSRASIARLIGYVGQQPFVFAGTIEDNIAYGIEDASAEAIEKAAQLACIHDEILAMPGGYKAEVAERGQNLSGGQRQRLALARLFLKNPPILILDEATSALDNICERAVQRALLETRSDRTVIVVAHRLSTMLDADRILVFDQGQVVESGGYSELVQKGGVFAELLLSAQEGATGATAPLLAVSHPEPPAPVASPAPLVPPEGQVQPAFNVTPA